MSFYPYICCVLTANQCPDINAPVNGALVCNNWKTDYGRFCTILCQDTYTVARGVNPDDFYVCGASGSWTPDNNIPDCSGKKIVHIYLKERI